MGFPSGASGKEPTCQCKRHGFDPWVRKTPWRRVQKPTPLILLGKSSGQRSLAGYSPWGRKRGNKTEAAEQARTPLHRKPFRAEIAVNVIVGFDH